VEAQFQPVHDPSVPAAIAVVNKAMQAYSFAPASEAKLTNPMDVQDTIQGFKFGEVPGPDAILKRALKHLLLSVISLIVTLLEAIFLTQYLPAA
jgi:hypothetical protein